MSSSASSRSSFSCSKSMVLASLDGHGQHSTTLISRPSGDCGDMMGLGVVLENYYPVLLEEQEPPAETKNNCLVRSPSRQPRSVSSRSLLVLRKKMTGTSGGEQDVDSDSVQQLQKSEIAETTSSTCAQRRTFLPPSPIVCWSGSSSGATASRWFAASASLENCRRTRQRRAPAQRQRLNYRWPVSCKSTCTASVETKRCRKSSRNAAPRPHQMERDKLQRTSFSHGEKNKKADFSNKCRTRIRRMKTTQVDDEVELHQPRAIKRKHIRGAALTSLLSTLTLYLTASTSPNLFVTALYGPVCERSEILATIKNPNNNLEAPTCVSQCSASSSYACPATSGAMAVSAKPVCALQGADLVSFFCVLACNVDADCPSSGSCRSIARAPAQSKLLGICVTPGSGDSSTTKVDAGPGFPPVPGQEAVWRNIGPPTSPASSSGTSSNSNANDALQLLARTYSIPATEPALVTVQKALNGDASASVPGGGAGWSSSTGNMVPSMDGNWLDDTLHDVKYFEKHVLDGDLISKELHDTYWNITHLHTGAYAILHGLSLFFLFYCLVGMCLKHYVAKAQGYDLIPHKEFWASYPTLVADGGHIVKNFVVQEVFQRGKGAGGSYGPRMTEYNNFDYNYRGPTGVGAGGGSDQAGFGTGML
ncbi:unnamed protein product [Amoebophrya sp. A120]|nr:unnamed protein product [Amoebophrya sp. A120]|eukprot:GSA120T00017214001.1